MADLPTSNEFLLTGLAGAPKGWIRLEPDKQRAALICVMLPHVCATQPDPKFTEGEQAMLADHLKIATHSSVLSHLSDKTRAGLLSRSRVMHYNRGATIFTEGDRASTMKVVLRGWVKLYRITAGGNEVIVQLLPIGRSFEEFASLYCAPYSISAQAVSDCTLLHVDVNSGQAQGDVQSEITMAVLLATSNHMDDLLCEVEQLKAQNGAQRLTEFLLKLCQNADGACEVELPYEKTLIAGRLGMKPESLSRAFGRLKSLGVRIRQTQVSIGDVAVLRAFVREDPSLSWADA